MIELIPPFQVFSHHNLILNLLNLSIAVFGSLAVSVDYLSANRDEVAPQKLVLILVEVLVMAYFTLFHLEYELSSIMCFHVPLITLIKILVLSSHVVEIE